MLHLLLVPFALSELVRLASVPVGFAVLLHHNKTRDHEKLVTHWKTVLVRDASVWHHHWSAVRIVIIVYVSPSICFLLLQFTSCAEMVLTLYLMVPNKSMCMDTHISLGSVKFDKITYPWKNTCRYSSSSAWVQPQMVHNLKSENFQRWTGFTGTCTPNQSKTYTYCMTSNIIWVSTRAHYAPDELSMVQPRSEIVVEFLESKYIRSLQPIIELVICTHCEKKTQIQQ